MRKRIRKILVPLDGSKPSLRALDEAIFLARQCHATITGLHVISPYPRSITDLIVPIKSRLVRDANDLMGSAMTACAKKGILFHKKIVFGDPKSRIAEFASDGGFDLLVMGARGIGRVREMLLGSVSTGVLHRSKTDILIIK